MNAERGAQTQTSTSGKLNHIIYYDHNGSLVITLHQRVEDEEHTNNSYCQAQVPKLLDPVPTKSQWDWDWGYQ